MRNLILTVMTLAFLPGFLFAQEPTPDATKEIDAWVKGLTEKIAAENETIRRSVQAAVVAVGKPAIAHLQAIAKTEGKAAEEAKRLITRIERSGQRRPGGDEGEGAQGGGRGGAFGGRGGNTDRLMEQLGLSADQQKKLDAFNESRRTSMTEMREKMMNGEMSREDFRDAMSKQRDEQNAKMKEILTEDQMKKFEELMQNFRGQGGRGGRGQGGQGGGRRGGGGQIEN